MTRPVTLLGRRVLVVEDDFFIADDLATYLKANGAHVVGPAGTVDGALHLIEAAEQLDGAVVDINLRSETGYPVADALIERGIPLVFTTGYEKANIPPRYAHVPWCEKPVNASKIVCALFG